MRRTWVVRPVEEASVSALAGALEIPPLLARVLIHRGADSPEFAHDFLCSDLGRLAPPTLMADLDRAVHLILRQVERCGKILIVGDYDADGVTSAALLYRVLRSLGGEVRTYIPHRIDDGYGLKPEVIRQAAEEGVGLLISTDCGTTAFEELALARSLGLETVVVDHHDLDPQRRPPCSAFLNPLRPDCSYPEKGLASVGVAFTLARGLAAEAGRESSAWDHLDLVALGTVADLAPLTGENRTLVKIGLHALAASPKPGLRALLAQTGLAGQALTAEDIGYTLAPPINAMGRIGSAEVSFRLLTTEEPEEARALAQEVCRQNRNRAAMGREAFKKALVKVAREVNFSRDRVIVLEDERWHPGVVGILATRLASRFHRPTVVIAPAGETCRGSARSIRSFHLIEALHLVKEHLIDFGGHPAAAGLTIARERVAPFREALNRVAHERLDPKGLSPSVELDGELPLGMLTEELMRDLELLAPFGMGNPRPVFLSSDGRIPEESQPAGEFSPFGMRVRVEGPEGRSFEALQPREMLSELNLRRVRGSVRLVYSPVLRRDGSGCRIELRLRDLRF
ncbi:MAG: single-stranded-DNA-specific exonuclease RecJ [Candidatus Omnitrophica bacterium]|nr:single-stranded-DNA-specific exonuclease RecJ [Candidatus Omnitrophota bacterium]